MDESSALLSALKKWSQDIPDMSAAILHWWRHLEPDSAVDGRTKQSESVPAGETLDMSNQARGHFISY